MSNKSDTYQYLFREILINPNDFEFLNVSPLPIAPSELDEIKFKIINKLLDLAQLYLTTKQHRYFSMFMRGYSQTQIAERYGVHVSTINSMLLGKWINPSLRYGGVFKALKREFFNDVECLELWQEMQEIKNGI